MTDEVPEVLVIRSGGYIVASKSVPGAWRLVRGRDCSCPAGDRPTCRHRKLVAAFCAREAEKYKRPVAAPHIAALVD